MELERLNILLADDDPDDRFLFETAVKDIRVKVNFSSVNDGVHLMNYLNNTKHPLPHVVFLDLNMPRKGGMKCLEEIRSNENMKHISVAIYSTSMSEADIEETFIKGANIYINKPNNFTKLKEIIEEVITVNWQYHTSGLNRDNFLLSL